ncbi:hypothetical protein TorRG33x02_242450 [Trema orientale]|uniref:Transmembrane protein n=1 Tax=Trema orientale TaxID=63057 RepID=A0A2P5DTD7_TREOI|nr:hypothetical protein TorRG33x02_242450 [Trema orientale]
MNRRFLSRPRSLLYLPKSLSDITLSGWFTRILLIFKTNFSFLSLCITLSRGSSFLLFTTALIGPNGTLVFLGFLKKPFFSCKTKLLPKNGDFSGCIDETEKWDFTESLGVRRKEVLYETKKGREEDTEALAVDSKSLGSIFMLLSIKLQKR